MSETRAHSSVFRAHTLQPGEVAPITLKKGDKFPRCLNCDRIHKGAQYILLTKHKRY